jgi:adenylate cyclase class IV
MTTQEKEIKIELKIPLDRFIARAVAAGFHEIKKVVQIDKYFDTPDWKLYKSVAAVRVRMVDGKDHSFAFKKVFRLPSRPDPVFVEEIEGSMLSDELHIFNAILDRLGIPSQDSMTLDSVSITEVLLNAGFQDEQVMEKTRRIFIDNRGNEIVIDEIKDLFEVIEIESKGDDPKKVLGTILAANEWTRGIVGTGYIWLEKIKGFSDHDTHPAKFDEAADWNVWDNERELYDELQRT